MGDTMDESVTVIIRRQKNKDNESYFEKFEYCGDLNIPIISLLEQINNQYEIKNIKGNIVEPIKFSCSCLQGLCGDCGILINGLPKLACTTFLIDEIEENGNEILLEPFPKFPVIVDLIVDKEEMYESLKSLNQWIESDAKVNLDNIQTEYEMSLCLMCGCCLVACPNYSSGDLFKGVPLVINSLKFISQEKDKKHSKELKKNYNHHFYSGCTKSLLCEDVCPMEIPIQRSISKMNRLSVWKLWQLISNK